MRWLTAAWAAALLAITATCLGAPAVRAAEAGAGVRLEKLLSVRPEPADPGQPQSPDIHILRVRAVDAAGQPVAAVPVRFRVLSVPDGQGTLALHPTRATTGADGIAESRVMLGPRAGTYAVGAEIANASPEQPPVAFTFQVRDLRWWLALVLGLAGGLAIFLYGMRLMSDGMRNVLGNRMRALLAQLTHNRVVAVFVGTFVTMVIQSSSATTVMLVGFVQARLMSFAQTPGVILGARIGTTITAQIIAFRISDVALLFVAAGFLMLFLARREPWSSGGQSLLGFGLLFFGMQVMAEAMRPLASYEPFLRLLLALDYPLLGVLLGAALTALIQSSSAFTGILIVLASQGLLTLPAAIPLVLGANIGTAVTAALASIDTRREAKRVALLHALFHVGGVLIFIWFVTPFAALVEWASPAAGVPRQIANAHTLFNVTITLIFLPFVNPVSRLVLWLLPDLPEEAAVPYKAVYLDEAMLATPALALRLARAEVVRMGELVKEMVERCVLPFLEYHADALRDLERVEEEVNFLQERIDAYLAQITQRKVTEGQVEEAFQMMYAVTELEQIADIVVKTIRPRARQWLGLTLRFSPQGEEELRDMHLRTVKQIARAITLLREVSRERAARMRLKYRKYRAMEMAFMRSHFERLRRAVPESLATGEYHQELMEQLVRITSHATNIARIMLPDEEPLVPPLSDTEGEAAAEQTPSDVPPPAARQGS